MFDLVRPCNNCPIRASFAPRFGLCRDRLEEMRDAPAFQCHKTVDYSEDDPRPGNRPQQCAGMMALLHRIGKPNTIMQVAQRLIGFDAGKIESTDIPATFEDLVRLHGGREC